MVERKMEGNVVSFVGCWMVWSQLWRQFEGIWSVSGRERGIKVVAKFCWACWFRNGNHLNWRLDCYGFLRRQQKNEVRKGVCKVFLCFERRRSHFVKVNITCLRKALLKWHYHRDKRAENCSLLKYVCSFVSTRHWTVWFAEKKLFFETFVLSKSATIMSMHAGLLRVNALSS